MKKIGLFFGGLSNEHDVPIMSAKNIVNNIDVEKYEIILFYWSKDGFFYKLEDILDIEKKYIDKKIYFENIKEYIDIALLMTHGKYGEDGVLQGLLEWQKIPYCGCRILSSSLCMDKGVFKEFMKNNNIKQTEFDIIDFSLIKENEYQKGINNIKNKYKLPIYVKPANSGSSVGITKVEDFSRLEDAILEAKKHDNKIIIEEGLNSPKEIGVGVLGNEDIIVSEPGELILAKDFYDYEDKYKNNEAKTKIPADIEKEYMIKIKDLAGKIYKICDCRGFARIDFFISNNQIYINEINTLPGFTDISMFPMLMKNSGISYKYLIDHIISLAY